MAINITDFDKIWASTSPLTPYAFSDANYQQGWNFVGATPPARQMWDSYMKWSDEKQQYIVNNFLPLSGVQTGKTESTSVSANGYTDVSITFSPAFSSTPIVLLTPQTSYSGIFATAGSVTTSGATIKINNVSSNTRSITVGWVAISI